MLTQCPNYLLFDHERDMYIDHVVGVKTPVAPQEQSICLHVGRPDMLVGMHWTKEYVHIGT